MINQYGRDLDAALAKFEAAHQPDAKPPKPQLSRGEMAGAVLAVLFFGYGLWRRDIPLIFVTLSFLLFMSRPFARAFLPHGEAIARGLTSFCLTIFIGALLIAFF